MLPSSERNYPELLELIVSCKAYLLLTPKVLSKKDINLTSWSQHVCRCRSLVKELLKLRDVELNCLDVRVEFEPNDKENSICATIVIHFARKVNCASDFKNYPVAVIWLGFQGLENYPFVKVS